MIAAGFPRQAAFVASMASACNDHMYGGSPGTGSGSRVASAREHLGRGVHADHLVAERRQVRGVAAGTVGGVESDPDGEAVEDLAHDGLLDVEEVIPRLVVERCPPVVAFARRDGTRLDPVAQLLTRMQERLDLAKPGEGEVPVLLAGERSQQGYPLQAEEIRQWMLVDHGRVDARILIDLLAFPQPAERVRLCAMARPDPGPDMRRLADQFVGMMRELEWELDYSEESVRTLEDMIDRQFADWWLWPRKAVAKKNLPIASLVGAYLGEVMIRHIGGRWGWMPDFDVAAVELPSGTWTSPPAKAQKRFLSGEEDNLLFYYQALKASA
jgi:hypothetical protein